MHKAKLGAVALEISERGVDEGGAEPLRGDQRVAGAASARQRLAQNRAGEKRGGLARLSVERGEEERPRQPLVKNAVAIDDLVHARVPTRKQQAHHRQIIERPGAGHAAVLGEDPPGNRALVRMEQPMFARRQVGEGELGFVGTGKLPFAANGLQERQGRLVGRQQQMIAVVDVETESRLEIRAAAAAGVARELMHDDGPAAAEAGHRGREPGETGAHDMNRAARHHTMP